MSKPKAAIDRPREAWWREGYEAAREQAAAAAGLNCWPLDGRQTQDDIVRRIHAMQPAERVPTGEAGE